MISCVCGYFYISDSLTFGYTDRYSAQKYVCVCVGISNFDRDNIYIVYIYILGDKS